jgi:hypothetical protein
LAGVLELPSAAWQATQAWLKMASPLAKSGLAALGAGPAAKAEPATKAADRAVIKREEIDFMA